MAPDSPIVCHLDALRPLERTRHAELTEELRSRVRAKRELPHGYAFEFGNDPAFSRRLIEWMALERRCCPFLEFELRLGEPDEPVVLGLTGAGGIKEFLADELSFRPYLVPIAGPDIAIGPLEPGEEDALLGILERCRLPEAGVREHLATALAAREEGRVIGTSVLEIYAGGALLRSVAVDPKRRGIGLGVRLTEAALDLARRRGIGRVYLLTETAVDFFPRFGFREVSRDDVPETVRASVEFQGACPQSAVVMEKAL